MTGKCPFCGEAIETDIEVTVGQHVVCPWCERKFSYGEPREKPARIEVPKINDGGEQTRANVRCSHCGAKFEVEKNTVGKLIKCKACGKSFVAGREMERPQKNRPKESNESNRRDDQATLFEKLRAGLLRIVPYVSRSARRIADKWRIAASDKPLRIECSEGEKSVAVSTGGLMSSTRRVRFGRCPSLASLLCRFPASFLLAFRKTFVIRCRSCSAIDVVCVPHADLGRKTTVTCYCGHRFEVREGYADYLSWLGGITNKIRRRRAVDKENEKRKSVRNEFFKQLKMFEDDWLVYFDPKAEVKIARVKELTDRFYKKLNVANANKLHHAQHTNTRLMSMYASDNSVVQIISGVAALASSGKDAECEYDAKDLQMMIERNEHAVDYFYELGEEFAGKDKDEAREARLMKRVGYVQESNLPVDEPLENIVAEEKMVNEINGYVRKKVGRYTCARNLAVGIVIGTIAEILLALTDVQPWWLKLYALPWSILVICLVWRNSENAYDATNERCGSC